MEFAGGGELFEHIVSH